MKKLTSILVLLFVTLSCQAQTISLEQAAICKDNPDSCSPFDYAKDINNSLDMYVGTWKGSYNNKNYEFRFVKKTNIGKITKWDKLIGRLQVTDNNGNTIYSSFEKPDDDTFLFGTNFTKADYKIYTLAYIVNMNCNDSGTLFLISKPGYPDTQLFLRFFRDSEFMDASKCPNNYELLIPKETTITLIKQ